MTLIQVKQNPNMIKSISLLIILLQVSLFSQNEDVKTILKKEDIRSSFDVFTKDSSDTKIPGIENRTTPAQDSAYAQALRMKLPIELRLRYDLMNIGYTLISLDPEAEKTGMDYIPTNAFKPDPNMIVQRQENLMRAFEVPYARTYNPYGVRLSFADIGSFFGLTEDYSGNIQFKVDHYTEVEVVIYSIQAVVVATIFKGHLPPGSYQRTWTGRDENGRKLPPGDYIGEVRIKGENSYRKQIIIR
ncbi:MAG: FlgD immunoglobulin-like domain containing protein [Candidatus Kapaibacterium sp.]